MALLDIFKKKKPEKKEEKEKKPVVKKAKPAVEPDLGVEKEIIKKKAKPALKKTRKIVGRAYRFLKIPHVSEKATGLTEKNQYIFRVYPSANKIEVKKAVQDVYGVDVASVRIINVPRKKRRLGMIEGFRKGYKKAIVKVKGGQKIEVMPR